MWKKKLNLRVEPNKIFFSLMLKLFFRPILLYIGALFFRLPDVKTSLFGLPDIEIPSFGPLNIRTCLSFALIYLSFLSTIISMASFNYTCCKNICCIPAFTISNLPLFLPYSRFKYILLYKSWPRFFISSI